MKIFNKDKLKSLLFEETIKYVFLALLAAICIYLLSFIPIIQSILKINILIIIYQLIIIIILSGLIGSIIMYFIRQKKIRTLRELSSRDELTNIYNSREFKTRLNEEIERSKRYKTPLTFILIDIDGFKEINDKYNYETGDYILLQFVDYLKSSIRKSDLLFRYKHGDEFIIIATNTNEIGGRTLAERIRNDLCKYTFQILKQNKSVLLKASAGVWEYNPKITDVLIIIETIEKALLKAKEIKDTVYISNG